MSPTLAMADDRGESRDDAIQRLAAEQRADNRYRIDRFKVGRSRVVSLDWIDEHDIASASRPRCETEALMIPEHIASRHHRMQWTGQRRSLQLEWQIRPLLDRLTEKQREVLRLLFWEQMTEVEAAAELGIGRGTLRGHRDLALKKLRSWMTGGLEQEAS